jgi:hypothetical protein
MPHSFRSTLLSRRITLTFAALAAAFFAASNRFLPDQPSQETDAPRDARVEVFTLTPAGFEPAEVTLPAGDYLLVFNNRTGLDEFALWLDREGHATVRQAERWRAW